ncbi:metaxin-1 [Tribolium castaneum]|uniref:Metaxin-1 homolog-like Protein n=1 Tax=Tribolium castaneum TaxID=7070 RepID=D6WAT3_TRICA|nr:PREDICTED: metaxin-1 [Tribolium castaneum]EEZ98680.1 Metaxin-1 homolog-like Protein [Tribolium castaneum]|eukprot:XP_968192.1 PREDICTED: metaxin-1 [Tribolium castaneum]
MDKPASLYVIEGDYGLVSLDVGCIESIFYARLKKLPVEIKLQNGVKSCALYSAPSLRCGNVTVTQFPKIHQHWKSLHGDLDHSLSAKDSSETLALINLVTMKLNPVLEFLYWVDQRNNEEFISRWFMSALPFPFNYSYTKRKKSEALQLIETLYPLDSDMEVVKEFVTKTATTCLSTLSTRLGKAKFFYGDCPMTVDVVVYAHLAPLVKLPFPTNDIPALLSMWPNLTEFVKRIDAKYFPDVKREVKYLQTESNNRQSDDDVSYLSVFILVVSATSLVVGFAVKKGFIKLSNFF